MFGFHKLLSAVFECCTSRAVSTVAMVFHLQFKQYMHLLNEMVTRVETEHRTKLEQLNKMQERTK